jgi:hypothetical protein
MKTSKTTTIDFPKVKKLIAEYEADRNCFADLWIQSEDVNEKERALFIHSVIK